MTLETAQKPQRGTVGPMESGCKPRWQSPE